MARNSGGTITGRFFYLILQLAVVFAGVYGAFYLNEKKAKENQLQRIVQIHEHFINETKLLENNLTQLDVIDTAIDKFFVSYKNSEMPAITDFYFPFTNSNVNANIWQSILNSGAIEILNFETVIEIDNYVDLRSSLQETVEKGNEYQKDLVLPNLDKGIYEFYDFRTKQLKPKYSWFLSYLTNLQDRIKSFKSENKELTKSLSSKLEIIKK